MSVFEDYKGQFERVSKECSLSQKKLTEEIISKRQKKESYENELERLKIEIVRR